MHVHVKTTHTHTQTQRRGGVERGEERGEEREEEGRKGRGGKKRREGGRERERCFNIRGRIGTDIATQKFKLCIFLFPSILWE